MIHRYSPERSGLTGGKSAFRFLVLLPTFSGLVMLHIHTVVVHLSGYAAGMQEATMTKTRLEDFLNACVAPDPDGNGLSMDELYGVYLSWCGLEGAAPAGGGAFSAGLRAANVRPAYRGGRCPGLRMTGPAACDYLVRREFPLDALEASAGRPRPIPHPALNA
jgi:hypothetical protein